MVLNHEAITTEGLAGNGTTTPTLLFSTWVVRLPYQITWMVGHVREASVSMRDLQCCTAGVTLWSVTRPLCGNQSQQQNGDVPVLNITNKT